MVGNSISKEGNFFKASVATWRPFSSFNLKKKKKKKKKKTFFKLFVGVIFVSVDNEGEHEVQMWHPASVGSVERRRGGGG